MMKGYYLEQWEMELLYKQEISFILLVFIGCDGLSSGFITILFKGK